MCEFCENGKLLSAKLSQSSNFISSVAVCIKNGKLVSQTLVQWADGITNPPPIAEVKIKYCPVCRRELNKD